MAWTLERSRSSARDYIADNARPYGRRSLATVTHGTREDALMMVAAPDMLEALREARDVLAPLSGHDRVLWMVERIIAKASGA